MVVLPKKNNGSFAKRKSPKKQWFCNIIFYFIVTVK
jgi:hypothetical protein